jgi:hypothetical protein
VQNSTVDFRSDRKREKAKKRGFNSEPGRSQWKNKSETSPMKRQGKPQNKYRTLDERNKRKGGNSQSYLFRQNRKKHDGNIVT